MESDAAVALLREATGVQSWGALGAWLDAHGGVSRVLHADANVFSQLPGVGQVAAHRIAASIALGAQLVRERPMPKGVVICDAATAFAVLSPSLQALDHEEFHVLMLDRRRRLIRARRLTVGSERFTVVDPPQVFRAAIACGASAIIAAHNHPSGDPEPSAQDLDVTRRLSEAGAVLGVDLLDHIVVAGDRYVSLAARGTLSAWRPVAACWTADRR